MLFHFAAVLVFIIVGTAFIFGNLLIGWLVRPDRPSKDKNAIYECGEPTIGSSWIRYNIRFYTIALVYLIFDVEVVFLFPVALVLKELRMIGLLEVLMFIGILSIGLAYAWRYGSLNWIDAKHDHTSEEGDGETIQELNLGI